MKRRHFFRLLLTIGLAVTLLLVRWERGPPNRLTPHLAYGFNLYADVQGMLNMGFDWKKGFPGSNLAGLSAAGEYSFPLLSQGQ